MTQPMENNWFQEELTHLEHLAKIVPDSPVVASMLSTFLTRMKANQCWTSQAIVALLGQATNIQLPEPMHKQLMETIQSLQCATGSHMKLANAGQHVQALAPYGRSVVLVRFGLTGSWHQAQHHMTMLQAKRKSPVVVALWRKLVEVVVDEPDLLGHVVVLEIP